VDVYVMSPVQSNPELPQTKSISYVIYSGCYHLY
jgi:hypothetical protein